MPDMNGEQMILVPADGLRGLFVSGYSMWDLSSFEVAGVVHAWWHKPFTMRDFRRTAVPLLEGPAAA